MHCELSKSLFSYLNLRPIREHLDTNNYHEVQKSLILSDFQTYKSCPLIDIFVAMQTCLLSKRLAHLY